MSFLYHEDPNIPSDVMQNIRVRLIEKIERTTYSDRECAESAIAYLLGGNDEKVLPSARSTWLEDHQFPPTVKFDPDITNRVLIPEAIRYARQNIPFLKQ